MTETTFFATRMQWAPQSAKAQRAHAAALARADAKRAAFFDRLAAYTARRSVVTLARPYLGELQDGEIFARVSL